MDKEKVKHDPHFKRSSFFINTKTRCHHTCQKAKQTHPPLGSDHFKSVFKTIPNFELIDWRHKKSVNGKTDPVLWKEILRTFEHILDVCCL